MCLAYPIATHATPCTLPGPRAVGRRRRKGLDPIPGVPTRRVHRAIGGRPRGESRARDTTTPTGCRQTATAASGPAKPSQTEESHRIAVTRGQRPPRYVGTEDAPPASTAYRGATSAHVLCDDRTGLTELAYTSKPRQAPVRPGNGRVCELGAIAVGSAADH